MKHRHPADIEERLVLYERFLHAWSPRLDLISPGDRARIRERHIDDSLRALPAITAAPAGPCIDVGSGAGLPGIPLAIASGRVWRLLEPRRRRAAFLEEVVRELGLDGCQVFPLTAQQAAATPELAHRHVIATARALAAPAAAAELCRPLVRPDGTTLLFVGVGAENPPNSAEMARDLLQSGKMAINLDEPGNNAGIRNSDSSPIPTEWKLLETRPIRAGRGRTVCVANQKGGVAKTTTSVNLGAALALRGHRVLLVDVDPQANATTGVGLDHRNVAASTYDLLIGSAPLAEVAQPTLVKNFMCAPASLDLAGAEIELAGAIARERKLAEALEGAGASYDVILVDCPPSLGLLTLNALAAAEDLIVPVQCEYYALEGLGQLMATAERVRRSLNEHLRVVGFLLTMYDARTKLASQVADEVRAHFGETVFETLIPRSVRLSEAPSFGEPVVTLDPSSRGAIAYRLLAAEVEARYELEVHIPPPPPVSSSAPQTTEAPVKVGASGPGGRGYGTVAAEPAGLDRSWPRREPWTVRS